MTDDLVKRLRGSKGDIYQMVCMMSEAADRIEELETALKRAAHELDMEGLENDYALAALGEKKDD